MGEFAGSSMIKDETMFWDKTSHNRCHVKCRMHIQEALACNQRPDQTYLEKFQNPWKWGLTRRLSKLPGVQNEGSSKLDGGKRDLVVFNFKHPKLDLKRVVEMGLNL